MMIKVCVVRILCIMLSFHNSGLIDRAERPTADADISYFTLLCKRGSLRVVPIFSSGIVERAKRKRA